MPMVLREEAHSFDYLAIFSLEYGCSRQAHFESGLNRCFVWRWLGLCAMARDDSSFQVAIPEAAFPTLPEFWKHYPIAHAALRLSQWVWPSARAHLRPERLATMVKNTSLMYY